MSAALACGIDIGGTKIAGAVVTPDGEVVLEDRAVSPAAEPEALIATVLDLIARLRAEHEVVGVGVGAAGYVNARRTEVLFAPNIVWRNEPLGTTLAERTGLKVVVENDANAAAWGEFGFGAGREVSDQLMVTVGTGVGGGIITGGRLLRGAFGVAGEIGHLCVVPDGLRCGCGNRGCLEQYASGTALVRRARYAAEQGRGRAAALIDRAGGEPARITGPMITAAAQDGDRFAVEQFVDLGHWLGRGIASLVAVLDPAAVVIGGGVASAGDLLLDPVRATFEELLTGRGYRPQAEIRLAELGNRAGVIGAADLVRR